MENSAADLTSKKRSFIAEWMYKIASVLGVSDLGPDRVDIYIEVLGTIRETALQIAFVTCLETWVKPGQMPPPAVFLSLIASHQMSNEEEERKASTMGDQGARKILEKHRGSVLDVAKQIMRGQVTDADVESWLQQGKDAQRVHAEKLATDPRWLKSATRSAVPGYRQNAETLSAERNGETKVPKDPEERHRWAIEKARTQGWTAP